jgi:hypothetical protein
VSADELLRWALKLRDVSLLPSFDTIEDLYPPGSQRVEDTPHGPRSEPLVRY